MSESDAAGMALTWMDFQPGEYEARLEQKLADLRRMFATVLPEGMPVDTFASAPTHFRQRARFALARLSDDERLHYALYNRGEPQRIEPSFPVASREINMLMPLLLDAINASEALAAGIAAVHFLSTQAGDILRITLIYSAALRPDWRAAALAMQQQLAIPSLVGRAKGECVVLGRPYVDEELTLTLTLTLNLTLTLTLTQVRRLCLPRTCSAYAQRS